MKWFTDAGAYVLSLRQILLAEVRLGEAAAECSVEANTLVYDKGTKSTSIIPP